MKEQFTISRKNSYITVDTNIDTPAVVLIIETCGVLWPLETTTNETEELAIFLLENCARNLMGTCFWDAVERIAKGARG